MHNTSLNDLQAGLQRVPDLHFPNRRPHRTVFSMQINVKVTDWVIRNGQPEDIDNTGYTRHRTEIGKTKHNIEK